jgi:hypothetical protein
VLRDALPSSAGLPQNAVRLRPCIIGGSDSRWAGYDATDPHSKAAFAKFDLIPFSDVGCQCDLAELSAREDGWSPMTNCKN